MTTTTPKFETTRRHTALGFAVIASLCISLIAGFVSSTSTATGSGGPELRAAAQVAPAHHAS